MNINWSEASFIQSIDILADAIDRLGCLLPYETQEISWALRAHPQEAELLRIVDDFNSLPGGSRCLILEECELLARIRATEAGDGQDASVFLDLGIVFGGHWLSNAPAPPGNMAVRSAVCDRGPQLPL